MKRSLLSVGQFARHQLLRGVRPRAAVIHTPALLFVDNRFPSFVEQLRVFFDKGLLDASKTTLIYRDYRENRRSVQRFAEHYGLALHAFRKLRQLPLLQDGQVVFYPFNGLLNLRLLKNDRVAHVFLTHGESNKAPTIHRAMRLYDMILAPGEIAKDRYIEFGVLSPTEADERVVLVGTELVEAVLADTSVVRTGKGDTLVYLPTWEGGTNSERYTSVEHARTPEVLQALCSKLELGQVHIKAHPNLGARVPTVRTALERLVARLERGSLNVSTGALVPSASRAAFAAVDVSASEAMAVASHLRSVVLVRSGCRLYAPESYRQVRTRAVLELDKPESVRASLQYVNSEQEHLDHLAFRERCFSQERPWSDDATHPERAAALLELARERARDKRLRPLHY